MGATRVLVVDDHDRVRSALVAELSRCCELEVTGTAGSTEAELAKALECDSEVVLVDVKRIDGLGIDVCQRIVQARPSARVLILTSYFDPEEKARLESIGADGYLLKELDLGELLREITSTGSSKPVSRQGESA